MARFREMSRAPIELLPPRLSGFSQISCPRHICPSHNPSTMAMHLNSHQSSYLTNYILMVDEFFLTKDWAVDLSADELTAGMEMCGFTIDRDCKVSLTGRETDSTIASRNPFAMVVNAIPVYLTAASADPEWLKVAPGRDKWNLGDEIQYDGQGIRIRKVNHKMKDYIIRHFEGRNPPRYAPVYLYQGSQVLTLLDQYNRHPILLRYRCSSTSGSSCTRRQPIRRPRTPRQNGRNV
jgi:hypothetical protein